MKDFIRARTAEQIAERRNEIVNACEQIYMEGGFDAVTFKAISEKTSFTRPSIYNYYATKEEVMLDLFERYFVRWYGEIFAATDSAPSLTANALCKIITEVSDRYQNLFLMFSDLRNIEEGCRIERIAAFKKKYFEFNDRVADLIARRFPNTSAEVACCFIEGLLILFHGTYPISYLSDKQKEAIKAAGGTVPCRTFRQIFYGQMVRLTGMLE